MKTLGLPVQTKGSLGIGDLDLICSPEFKPDGNGDQHAAQTDILHGAGNRLALGWEDSDGLTDVIPWMAPQINPLVHFETLWMHIGDVAHNT